MQHLERSERHRTSQPDKKRSQLKSRDSFSRSICRYFERTAITSISTNAHGAANAATCIAALAGLLG